MRPAHPFLRVGGLLTAAAVLAPSVLPVFWEAWPTIAGDVATVAKPEHTHEPIPFDFGPGVSNAQRAAVSGTWLRPLSLGSADPWYERWYPLLGFVPAEAS